MSEQEPVDMNTFVRDAVSRRRSPVALFGKPDDNADESNTDESNTDSDDTATGAE